MIYTKVFEEVLKLYSLWFKQQHFLAVLSPHHTLPLTEVIGSTLYAKKGVECKMTSHVHSTREKDIFFPLLPDS